MVGETDFDDLRSHFTQVPKDSITDAMDMNLGKPRVMLRDREARRAAVRGVEEWDTTGDWTATTT